MTITDDHDSILAKINVLNRQLLKQLNKFIDLIIFSLIRVGTFHNKSFKKTKQKKKKTCRKDD